MLEDERRASLCIVYDVRYGNDDKRTGGSQLSAFEDEICVSIYGEKGGRILLPIAGYV